MLDSETYAFLKWPQDKLTLKQLSLDEKIFWFASQDPRSVIYLAQTPDFKKFWYRHYILQLKLKRFAYKIKSFLTKDLF